MSDSISLLYNRIKCTLDEAVRLDSLENYSKAYDLYAKCVKYMYDVIKEEADSERNKAVETKAIEIQRRIIQIQDIIGPQASIKSTLSEAQELVKEARVSKKKLMYQNAFDSYMDALGIYERIVKRLGVFKSQKHAKEATEMSKAIKTEMSTILTEAEATKLQLKRASNTTSAVTTSISRPTTPLATSRMVKSGIPPSIVVSGSPQAPTSTSSTPGPPQRSQNNSLAKISHHRRNNSESIKSLSVNTFPSSPSPSYSSISTNTNTNSSTNKDSEEYHLTRYELQIIQRTSIINCNTFVPWLTRDIQEPLLNLPNLFNDPDGKLKLSAKQQSQFSRWERLSEKHDCMISQINCESIAQDIVTDCSFVASLCVSAAFERRFKKQIITNHIYPHDEFGVPVFNPSGKYMVKLFVNGYWRKVLVDDYFPVSKSGKLMCTYTVTNEVWPCVVEKAFLKMMGGYDFPGSNSSIDLHALTGWIPEHVFIHDDAFNPEVTWARIRDGCIYGDTLFTIATGPMSAMQAKELGLVPSHAYAVLDVKEINGQRLLQVKNPWNRKQVDGESKLTINNDKWIVMLKETLGPEYADDSNEKKDMGIFWIDYESVCTYFDSIHLNWNPSLFPFIKARHFSWSPDEGPKRDIYNVGHNPQFCLKVTIPDGQPPSPVRLLISKHIQKTEENKDYISILVHNDTDGKRVYERKTPWRQSGYVNNVHSLVQFNAESGKTSMFTIIVSQQEKSKMLYFTLRAYSLGPISLQPIPMYPNEHRENGQWSSVSAGGNSTNPSYMNNPQYRLVIQNFLNPQRSLGSAFSRADSSDSFTRPARDPLRVNGVIVLETPQPHPVQIRVFRSGCLITQVLSINTVTDSGPYRKSFTSCYIEDLYPGEYTVLVSTYQPLQFGSYELYIALDQEFSFKPIPREGAGMRERILHGKWIPSVNAMGSQALPGYANNPKFAFNIKRPTNITVRLQAPSITPLSTINISIFSFSIHDKPVSLAANPDDSSSGCCADSKSSGDLIPGLGKLVASSGTYDFYPQGVAITKLYLDPKVYGSRNFILLPSTWDQNISGNFVIRLYSDQPLEAYSMDDLEVENNPSGSK
ncbi:cysteine protease [Mycoemilia scoparia]|uniref:Cysteine protease n=1 Tax=Mycoemilia scoparia TaxID=417184 RepID=A0A9W7ZJ53_9FUNG|nr:cysteine protease [Mycoemilia scoparia]